LRLGLHRGWPVVGGENSETPARDPYRTRERNRLKRKGESGGLGERGREVVRHGPNKRVTRMVWL